MNYGEPMIIWEAEEPAFILRHRAHRNRTEKIKLIGILQNSPWIKNSLNINKRNGVTSLPAWFVLFTRQRFLSQVYTEVVVVFYSIY